MFLPIQLKTYLKLPLSGDGLPLLIHAEGQNHGASKRNVSEYTSEENLLYVKTRDGEGSVASKQVKENSRKIRLEGLH